MVCSNLGIIKSKKNRFFFSDKRHFQFDLQWQVEVGLLSFLNADLDISFHVPTCCNWFGNDAHKIDMDTVFHLHVIKFVSNIKSEKYEMQKI